MKLRSIGLSFLFVITSLLNNSYALGAPKAELWDYWNHSSTESTASRVDHSQWQNFLDKYLDTSDESGVNLVRYGVIAGNGSQAKSQLSDYISSLEAIDPRTLNRDEQFAYWVNLYNATTIHIVVTAYPVTSIRKTGKGFFSFGPWDDVVAKIADTEVTLNDIEHRILRPIWKDPRIHFVVNCASIGCPNLHQTALTASNLRTVLDQATTSFINHPRAANSVDNTLELSSIFNWYAEDFGENEEAVVDYIESYLNQERAEVMQEVLQQARPKISYDYDWSLNQSNP